MTRNLKHSCIANPIVNFSFKTSVGYKVVPVLLDIGA